MSGMTKMRATKKVATKDSCTTQPSGELMVRSVSMAPRRPRNRLDASDATK